MHDTCQALENTTTIAISSFTVNMDDSVSLKDRVSLDPGLFLFKTVLFADNIPANTLAKEDIVTSGNQYIFLPYHYNKEVQEEGHSLVAYIVSGDNLSDLLTKAVGTKEINTLYEALTGHNLELILKYAAKAAELNSSDVPVIQI